MVGDWVIGPTHNSDGKILIGILLETMEQQGNCSARLFVFPSYMTHKYNPEVEGNAVLPRFGKDKGLWSVSGKEDYADVKQLVHFADGFRACAGIHEHAIWNSAYSEPTLG